MSPAPASPAADSLSANRQALREGAVMVGSTVLGTFLWGLAMGLALVKGGLSAMQALGMVMLVFSGTAQLAALPLIVQGAALPAIWFTALLANLRFVIYSVLVATEFRGRSLSYKLLLGWLTTDTGLTTYLAGQKGAAASQPEAARAARYLGANGLIYLGWTGGTAAGVLLAGLIPDSPRIGFIGVLAVVALVGPMLSTRVSLWVALAAGAVSLIGVDWPARMGMFCAIVAGVAVALMLTRQRMLSEAVS